MAKEKFVLYTDGGSRGNPGPSGAGVVITDSRGRQLKTASKALGKMTNNEAEYEAIIFGLQTLKRTIGKKKIASANVELRLDSELVAKQLRGEYQIKEEHLYPRFIKLWNMRVKDIPNLTITHIPRNKNKEADNLANEAMDSGKQNQLF